MKIAYILKKFPRLSETFILNELLALEKQGHQVEVYSLRVPDEEPRHASLAELNASVTVVRSAAPKSIFLHLDQLAKKLPGSRKQMEDIFSRLDLADQWRMEALVFAEVIAPMVKQNGVHHLHAHFATGAAATAEEVARRTGIPFSFTMHAKDIYRNGVDFDLLNARLKKAAFAVTVCQANLQWLAAHCDEDAAAKVRVLYNGIDLQRFPYQPGPRDPLFLAVGRLVEKKGFNIFIEACSLLQKQGVQFRAVIAGNGEDEHNLRALKDSLNLGGCVEMAGALKQEEVQALLARSLVLVAPCVKADDGNQDALPTVMLEALSTGTPCIGTPVGGIPEIIRDGEEGWLVPEHSAGRLAEVMQTAVMNPEESRKRGEKGRRRAEELFALPKNVGTLADWFQEAAAAQKAPIAVPM